MSDLEVAYNSDQEVSENHSNLITAVAQLDKKQRVNKAERSEPTLEVSEFHLVKSGVTSRHKDAVQVRDLVKSLGGQKGYQNQITKKFQSIQQKSKVISKPLEKPSADKVKMRFGFERTLKDLSRWNAIVAKNRTATQLFYPLRYPKLNRERDNPADFISRLRLKPDLQRKMEELDPKLKEPPVEEKDNKKEEKDNKKSEITLKDMRKKRSETAQRRARQSYQEAKAHRQRKIKSKKFHRIERKKKDKEQLMEFEKMQKTNPEEALAKLEQLDKSRAEERMSLRHKGTGQWAKNKQIRAKYNKEVRQELAEQLSISKELTRKTKSAADSDEDEALLASNSNEKKPCSDEKMESEVNDFIQYYRDYRDKMKSEKELNAKIDNEYETKLIAVSDKHGTLLACSNNNKKKPCNDRKTKSEDINFQCYEKYHDEMEKFEEELFASNIDSEDKSSTNKRKLDDILVKEISDKLNKKDTTISAVTSTTQKIEESMKDKKASENASTNYTVTSDEIISKKKRAKLCNEKNEVRMKNKYNVEATSMWHVEELQYNKKMYSKPLKVVDVDDMFDSVEENIKRKVNSKVQKIKKKLETEKKIDKHKKQKKEDKENAREDYTSNLEFKNSRQKPVSDLPLEETTSIENLQEDTDLTRLKTIMNTKQEPIDKPKSHVEDINLQKYIVNIKATHMNTEIPDMDVEAEDMLYDNEPEEEDFFKLRDEAFEDDNIEEEFRKEKEAEIKNSQPHNINTSLPGWGNWAGTNIKENKVKRKNRPFILKTPKAVPRKDENKGDVIIFEGENKKLKEHLVSELPYPFTTVKDFEASIRAPLGRTFVPENAHRRLIQPSVVIKSGQVIEPMTEDVLLKKQPTVKQRIDKQKKNNIKNNKKKHG